MAQSFSGPHAAGASERQVRVLHVDDDPDFASLTAEFLRAEDERFTVLTESSGPAALERLANSEVDCIVSDYDMPRMNGLELLEAVRERDAEIPFVLFTGKGSEEVASEAISRGVTEYMQKEIGTDQYTVLANRIANAVSRSRTERAVEDTREWFQTLIEESTDVVLVVDEAAQITYASPAATEVLGRTPGDLAGTNGLDPIDPADRKRVAEQFAALVEEPESRQCVEFRYHRPDGSTIWAETRGRNLLDNPVVAGIVVYIRDITASKEREQILESLYETTQALFGATTEAELCRTAVTAAEDILGLPLTGVHRYDADRDALVPVVTTDSVAEVLGSEPVYERDETLIWAAYERGEPQVVEDTTEVEGRLPETPVGSGIVYPLGEYGVLITTSTEPDAFDDQDLRFVRLVAGHVEVGLARLHDQELLDRERGRLSALFENVPDPINRVTLGVEQTVIEAVNPAFESTFGRDADDLLGKTPSEVHVPDQDAHESEAIDERVRHGEVVERHLSRQTTDGLREFLFRGIPVKRGRHSEEAFGVYVDVTESKQRERELERQNDRLDRLVSLVSHDLRNPLSVATNRLELLEADCDSEHLPPIARAHDRMATLVDDLLALAHNDEQALDVETVDLQSAVEDCWPGDRRDEPVLDIGDRHALRADPHRLHRLLANLFDNALSHAGEELTVTVGTTGDGEGFYVADDGPGIPPADRDTVFEFGYSTAQGGTGFGLGIVAEIAAAHGWGVSVAESPEGGAQIEVRGVEWVVE